MSVTKAAIRLEIGRSLITDEGKPVLKEIVNSGVVATSVTDAVNLQGTGRFTSQAFQGWTVRGNGGTAIGTKSYGTVLTPTSGLLAVNPSLQTTPANADTFEVWMPPYDPDDLDRAIDRGLSQDCTRYRLTPVNVCVDGDFETAGVGSWTGSNATPTKVTESYPDLFCDQSLKVTNSGANGYAGQTLNDVHGTDTYTVWGLVRATTGTAAFTVQDLTNSVAINVGNVTNNTWAFGGIGVVNGSFTIPATCKSISIRFGGQGASDVSIWSSFSIMPSSAGVVQLSPRVVGPTWVGLFYRMTDNAYPALVPSPLDEQPRIVDLFGTGWQGQFRNAQSAPLFYQEYQNYAALQTVYNTTAARGAADIATTNCPLEYIKAAAIKQYFGNEAKPIVTRGKIMFYARYESEYEAMHRTFGAKKTARFVDETTGYVRA